MADSSENRLRDGTAERLSLVLEAMRLGDWSWDVAADAVTCSARAAEICGIPFGRTMTREEYAAGVHPDDRERVGLAVDRALGSRTDYVIEYRLNNGNRERWISASGRGQYNERGDLIGVLGVIQDITKDRLLVRMDDAIRPLSEPEDIMSMAARMLGQHLAVDRCAYGFVEDDEDTFNLTGNYTQGVHSIVGRYRFRQFSEECLRLMRAGTPYIVEDSTIDPRLSADERGSYELAAIRGVICVPILKANKLVAAMAVHTRTARTWSVAEVEVVQQVASRCWESIERARVEAERASLLQAAQAANRAKDEFLAMLGHELRNPLAPILTAVQLMQLRGDTTVERERTVIDRQVRHLTRLVDDLLDVSRIARGKVDLEKELVELAEIVTRAIEVASPLLEQRAHTLIVDVARSGLALEGDGARLTQVVSNLLTNAGKYTPSGGTITLSGRVDAEHVVLRVRDTGIGMAADVLPNIFDLFVQGRQASDRAQGGLGLGLSIVKSLVEAHGGSVSAHSDGPGQGSELVVRLPHAPSAGPRVTPTPARSPIVVSIVKGTRILVVDDNADAAALLAAALADHGCEVHVAHDGPEALRLGATLLFDAALLDIGLPVMDGYELAARLRELPTLREACLVAVTGYGQESDRRRAIDAGFQHHLVKPVDLRAVEVLVSSLPSRPDAGR